MNKNKIPGLLISGLMALVPASMGYGQHPIAGIIVFPIAMYMFYFFLRGFWIYAFEGGFPDNKEAKE